MLKFCITILATLFVAFTACPAQNVMALIESGEAKAKAGDFNGAIADYTRAIRLAPNYRSAYVHRAAAEAHGGDWQGALADLNKALAIKPDSAEIFGARAFAHLNLGNFDAARSDFSMAARLDPKNGLNIQMRFAQDLITRARGKSMNGDNAAAIKDLDMIVGLAPELGVAYHERGAAKFALQQYKEAIADLDLAIKFDTWHNKQGESHILRAKAKRALGDIAGAEADEEAAAVLPRQ